MYIRQKTSCSLFWFKGQGYVYQKIIRIAQEEVIASFKKIVCRRLQTWKPWPEAIIAKLMRQHTKHNIMTIKKLQVNRYEMCLRDDVITLGVKFLFHFLPKTRCSKGSSPVLLNWGPEIIPIKVTGVYTKDESKEMFTLMRAYRSGQRLKYIQIVRTFVERTLVSNESDFKVGKKQLTKCVGFGSDGKPCTVWNHVWFSTKTHKRFESKPFLCAAIAMSGPPKSDVFQLPGSFSEGSIQTDVIEQYGRRWENVRFSGVIEEPGMGVYKEVVDDAEKTGVATLK